MPWDDIDSSWLVSGMDEYAQALYYADFLREDLLREVVRALHLPLGSRGLDAGCGIGGPTMLLAREVEREGGVVGIDISEKLLLLAAELAERRGLSDRVSFEEGDLNDIPFDDDTFDWVTSFDCAGYPAVTKPLPLMKELTRVVRPGGMVAIAGWTSQRMLPGHPLLEARLNTESTMVGPEVRGRPPESQFLRALSWFKGAGLMDARGLTVSGQAQAPLSEGERKGLAIFFPMLWGEAGREVEVEEWEGYQRLCLPDSPDFILDSPDYYAFFTYTVFRGTVPG